MIFPQYFENLPITRLAGYAFQRCYLITSVIILANIEIIPFRCFADCSSMSYIEIPSSVHTLEGVAISFYNHTNSANQVAQLKHTAIFKRNSKLKTIDHNVFEYVKQVSLIFQSSVDVDIDKSVFDHVEKIIITCHDNMRFGNFYFKGSGTLNNNRCFIYMYNALLSVLIMLND